MARARKQRGDLKSYRDKRDFERSPEPSGEGRGRARAERAHPRFSIQKHGARSLHYDLRLEVGDALASWAVPKGPSVDPSDKRLAMRTEDHPLEYLEFEGVIPEGEYGAGPMIVWDRGVYANIPDDDGTEVPIADGLARGHIKFMVKGDKLEGGWALTRVSKEGERERWILVKKRDDYADPGSDPVAERPESVLSGRKLEDLEAE